MILYGINLELSIIPLILRSRLSPIAPYSNVTMNVFMKIS